MSTAKTTIVLTVLTLALVGSCANKKDKTFSAFTDGFMDWYSLELYSDKTFSLHVPVADYSGAYKIITDTIFLTYDRDTVGTGPAPVAYLIRVDKKKIDELEIVGNNYQIRQPNNRWIDIVSNRLRE